MKAWTLVVAALFLAGCTSKIVFVDFNQEGANTAKEGTGSKPDKVINVMAFVTPNASFSTKTDQTTDGQVPISLYGANSATGNQAQPQATFNPMTLIEQVAKTADIIGDSIPDTANSDITNETVGAPVTAVKLRPIDNRSFEWLPETGAAYGKNVLFVFDNDCGELLVPDGAVSYGANGNPADFAQTYYFCGTDFAAGEDEYNAGRASIFTRPGCVSTKVTITRQ